MRMPSFDPIAHPAEKKEEETRETREPALCGDIDMRISRNGTWFYHGSPIGRKSLVRLFSTVLRRDDEGRFWLVTPVEKARIEVEDAPFVAVEMTATGEGESQELRFRTNVDDEVVAGPDHPIRVTEDGGEPAPYIRVRDGLEARLARSVFYELVERAELREAGGERVMSVRSRGALFDLGTLPDDADA